VTFVSAPQLRTVAYTRGQQDTRDRSYGLYASDITIENISDDKLLYGTRFFYEGTLGELNNFNLPTENTFSIVLADTVVIERDVQTGEIIVEDDIGTPRSNASFIKGGQFSTGNFRDQRSDYTFRWVNEAKGTLGFEFDYYLTQFGGLFRPDSLIEVISEDPVDTRIYPWDIDPNTAEPNTTIINTTQLVGEDGSGVGGSTRSWRTDEEFGIVEASVGPLPISVYATFNNGPGTYRVILGPEQQETMSFAFGDERKDFVVPFHDITVIEETQYTRPANQFGDSVLIDRTGELEHMELPTNVVGPF
jgi:hypothetical protein